MKPTTTASPSADITPDTTCLRCGYLLHGLERDGKCPECGLEIATSLSGGDLRRADPLWVRRLGDGAALAAAAMSGWAVLSLARLILMRAEVEPYTYWRIYNFACAAFIAVDLAGWMLFTARPAEDDLIARRHEWVRRALRGLAIGYSLSAALALVSVPGPALHQSAQGAAFATALGVTLLLYTRVRQIARAVGDARLAFNAALAMGLRLASVALSGTIWTWGLLAETSRARGGGSISPVLRIDPPVQIGFSAMTAAFAAYVLHQAWRRLDAVAADARVRRGAAAEHLPASNAEA